MWDEPIPGANSQAHDMKARLEAMYQAEHSSSR